MPCPCAQMTAIFNLPYKKSLPKPSSWAQGEEGLGRFCSKGMFNPQCLYCVTPNDDKVSCKEVGVKYDQALLSAE